ncbi:MAG TPA: outer membrane beta-barrel protein [Vicinamibacterales bacterium]|nr:outer membrane beta-barrel protein [Vicinamibacterales bacterium]
MQPTVHVLATTFEATRSALETAVPLARGAGARLLVLVPQVMPYPVDLEQPVQSSTFVARRYREVVEELGGEAAIRVCVCRRPGDIVQILPERAVVVVGAQPLGWLPNMTHRLARRISALGHHVVLVASLFVCLCLAGTARAQGAPKPELQYGAFIDLGDLFDSNAPANHLFRNRGTTPEVDDFDVNIAGAYVRKTVAESSRGGFEATVQTGKDSEAFGFSAVDPNLRGADVLRHFGPLNASYLAPVGAGLTIQGGIFSSLIGYDSLYAKDNLNYTRPWGADYTPYLMMGVNAAYPLSSTVTLTGFLINGYFHLAQSDSPTAGGQIAYKANDRITFKETAMYGSSRVLSDTWIERKTSTVTAAAEYQLGHEPQALWMSAQAPVQWRVGGPWALTVRPEFAWDRDGRWIGVPESVAALTTTVEYRAAYRGAHATVRGEYRLDTSRGSGGGFFADADNHLVPTQHLFIVAAILTFDGTHAW